MSHGPCLVDSPEAQVFCQLAEEFSTMEVFRFNILPMADLERRQAFKEAVNNCPVCGETMHFKHESDYLSNSIREIAECAKCHVQIREEEHQVQ